MAAGKLRDRVALDAPQGAPDAFGGTSKVMTEQFVTYANVIHVSGDEAISAARLAGRAVYKVKLRSNTLTQGIGTGWRMRHLRLGPQNGDFPGRPYDIKSVDTITDRAWVWMTVEAGDSA